MADDETKTIANTIRSYFKSENNVTENKTVKIKHNKIFSVNLNRLFRSRTQTENAIKNLFLSSTTREQLSCSVCYVVDKVVKSSADFTMMKGIKTLTEESLMLSWSLLLSEEYFISMKEKSKKMFDEFVIQENHSSKRIENKIGTFISFSSVRNLIRSYNYKLIVSKDFVFHLACFLNFIYEDLFSKVVECNKESNKSTIDIQHIAYVVNCNKELFDFFKQLNVVFVEIGTYMIQKHDPKSLKFSNSKLRTSKKKITFIDDQNKKIKRSLIESNTRTITQFTTIKKFVVKIIKSLTESKVLVSHNFVLLLQNMIELEISELIKMSSEVSNSLGCKVLRKENILVKDEDGCCKSKVFEGDNIIKNNCIKLLFRRIGVKRISSGSVLVTKNIMMNLIFNYTKKANIVRNFMKLKTLSRGHLLEVLRFQGKNVCYYDKK